MFPRHVLRNMPAFRLKQKLVMKWYPFYFRFSKYIFQFSFWSCYHFQALRIILQFLQTSAARYGRYIHPLLSVSVDFYVRLFVLVYTGKNECKSAASKLASVKFAKFPNVLFMQLFSWLLRFISASDVTICTGNL